jgi:archaellum component FlaC
MTEEPDSLVLVLLRRLDEKMDRVLDDMRDVKVRVTGLEEGLAGVNRRLDRMEIRIDRIERRLEIADAH